ncbi:MAG: TraB/GumN family protein [Pseudomonadota bacterium]
MPYSRHLTVGVLLAFLLVGGSTSILADSVTYQGLPVQATRAEQDAFVEQFENLPAPKALAMALTEQGQWAFGWMGDAAGTLPAIGGAISGCERARQQKQIEVPCELVRVNDEEVEYGRALRHRLSLDDGNTPALMWRLKKGRSLVYIGGSLHAFKPSLYPLPPAFEDAYQRADELILEVDITNVTPATLQQLRQKYLLLPDDQVLDDLLSSALLAQAQALATEFGVPWQALNRLTPGALSAEMAQALFMTRGLMPNSSFELYFSQRALADRKPIGELETLAFQFELVSRIPVELQEDDISKTLAESALQLDALIEAWMAGDAERLARLIRNESDSSEALRAFYHELFQQRNRAMAAKIAEFLDGGKSTRLVLIGAGHLAGEENVISLLAERGYRAEQLNRNGRKR